MMPGGIRLANHPNDGVGIEPRRGTPRRYKRRGMVCVDDGGGRGNLRVAKTSPLQSGICGDANAPCHKDQPFAHAGMPLRAGLQSIGCVFENYLPARGRPAL